MRNFSHPSGITLIKMPNLTFRGQRTPSRCLNRSSSLESKLREELEVARHQFTASSVSQPSGEAQAAYTRALERYSDFILSGKIPEDLETSESSLMAS